VHEHAHACPDELKCVILGELEHSTVGRNSFLVSLSADECVSLVVTCLGNITKIQLLPRYNDVVHSVTCNSAQRPRQAALHLVRCHYVLQRAVRRDLPKFQWSDKFSATGESRIKRMPSSSDKLDTDKLELRRFARLRWSVMTVKQNLTLLFYFVSRSCLSKFSGTRGPSREIADEICVSREMQTPSTALSSILSQPRTWIYFPNIPSMQTNDASRARWMHTVCVYSCRFENRPIMRAERARNRACRCAARCGGNRAMPRNALSDSLGLRCSGLQLSVYASALNPLLAIRSEIAGAWPSLSTSLNDKLELCPAVNGHRDTKNTTRPSARQSASLFDHLYDRFKCNSREATLWKRIYCGVD